MGIERADAAVVGSGPNGLAAAIRLARAGREVVVLEAEDTPGGGLRTATLTLPGFTHDLFSAVHPAAAASPVFQRLPLGDHGLEWVHPEVATAHPMDDGQAAALYRDVEETAAHLECFAPGDGHRWEELVRPYVHHRDAFRRLVLGGFPPVSGALRLLVGAGLQQALDFAQLLVTPVSVCADRLFRSEHARAWLYGTALHSDVPPTHAGSAVAGVYLTLLGHLVGWPSPRGGADGLATALIRYLESLGGRLRTGARVQRVVTVRGRVAGVETEGGDRVRAGTVVADVTPRGLLQLAGHALGEDYRRRMSAFRYGTSILKVDWALDGPTPWAAPEARRAGTVHVGGGAGEITGALAEIHAGRLPDRPFLLFGQQSIADPSRAPAGKHTAWAYTRVPDGIDWDTAAAAHVRRMEAQIDRFAPGFADRILARHVLTPHQLEARNANLVGGDVGAGSNTLDQLIFRPVPALVPYATPVRGLFLGSAATFPGGGVHGVPGWTAAGYALAASRLPW